MLMQKAQPLICEARVLTSSISDFSRPRGLDLGFQRAERFDGVGGGLVEIHPGLHAHSPLWTFSIRMIVSVYPDRKNNHRLDRCNKIVP